MGILYNMNRLRDPRTKRLAREHELLHEFCENSKFISYEIKKKHHRSVPEEYIIHYKLKSIIGIDANRQPIYGYNHSAEISLPLGFPLAAAPKCSMLTDTWHPNIRSSGNYKGRVCVNAKALGFWFTLDMLADRISDMLQYKNYHAENIDPYPEDEQVAKWVRNYAEPNGIVNKEKGICDDHLPPTPKKSSRIKVVPRTTPKKGQRRITIKRRNIDL